MKKFMNEEHRNYYKLPDHGKWSQNAINCYTRGCMCEGCNYGELYQESEFKRKCSLKSIVLELVKLNGAPKGIKTKGIIND